VTTTPDGVAPAGASGEELGGPTTRIGNGVSGRDVVPFGEAVRTWFAISLQTFGGPAGQIAGPARPWYYGGWIR